MKWILGKIFFFYQSTILAGIHNYRMVETKLTVLTAVEKHFCFNIVYFSCKYHFFFFSFFYLLHHTFNNILTYFLLKSWYSAVLNVFPFVTKVIFFFSIAYKCQFIALHNRINNRQRNIFNIILLLL